MQPHAMNAQTVGWGSAAQGVALPLTQVVAAQLDALQRNDWPDADAGVRAAFAFSKPADAETLLPGQVLAAVHWQASCLQTERRRGHRPEPQQLEGAAFATDAAVYM
jgi:hypothetical protein